MQDNAAKHFKFVAIVPAAGIGSRMGTKAPKQYLPLGDKTLIEHSVGSLLAHPLITQVIVALHPEDTQFSTLALAKHPDVLTTQGGVTRAASVAHALAFAQQQDTELFAAGRLVAVVHDAARPCLETDDLDALLSQFMQAPSQGALLASPVRDTMKRSYSSCEVSETVSREQLWHAQTPQVFLANALASALQQPDAAITDESSAMERAGCNPKLVKAKGTNIKVTHPEDLMLVIPLLSKPSVLKEAQACDTDTLPLHQKEKKTGMFRIGQGFDVHKFGGPGPVYLGGIDIAHDKGLLAHSDGDVLLHALCDALLGALALGDIGHLFPDTDPAYRGADSKTLLQEVYQRILDEGYQLVNADITVMAEAPKLKPHNEPIRRCISELLAVDMSQISVKATTTEKLGFTGREEGIACQAVVLLTPTIHESAPA